MTDRKWHLMLILCKQMDINRMLHRGNRAGAKYIERLYLNQSICKSIRYFRKGNVNEYRKRLKEDRQKNFFMGPLYRWSRNLTRKRRCEVINLY